MQEITGCIRKAAAQYKMISPGDKIAVGVSGGKDSMALLAGLAKLREFSDIPFEVMGITVDPRFGGIDTDYSAVESWCSGRGIAYIIRRSELGTIIFEERKEKNPCSLCARMRRGMLHDMAKEHGCNKLALGHNCDDAVETLLMNLCYEGRIACFQPVTWLSRKELTVIRPLIFMRERDVRNAVAREGIPIVKSACPADTGTSRQDMKQWLEVLEKTKFPGLRKKVFGAMLRGHISNW
ncbi:MAG: tRNA 2-thiocytidine biosynthesis TtcA family protein [Oscillospiraceae bacterium]|nr:tRNA 2-thiocytidine biosynthesis TtcA family protein [Oscillospiraceae bacterium]